MSTQQPHAEKVSDGTRYTHPSYGMLRFGRTQSTGTYMFGSGIQHSNYISLEISTASVTRKESMTDSYFSENMLIRISLSPVQFANAISGFDSMGTPCTIQRLRGADIPDLPPVVTEQVKSRAQMKAKLNNFADKFSQQEAEIEEILSRSKAPTKAELRKVQELLGFFNREIRQNIPFFAEMFEEQMTKVVAQAKGEVEAFVQNRITQLGMDALAQQSLGGAAPTAMPSFELPPSDQPL
jgi:hypothetical protein